MRDLVRAVFTALTRVCNSRLVEMHVGDENWTNLVNVSKDVPDVSDRETVSVPSPCTVVISDLTLQSNDSPVFEFHSQKCTHVFTKFCVLSGLVNHDLERNGWAGDHGTAFDPQGVLASTFHVMFTVFEQMGLQPKLSEIHEQACMCACLALAMKFTRRSALLAVPSFALNCDPRRVKLGHVFGVLHERGRYNEESLHTLVENWESFIIRSSLNLFRCCTANAAALAELRLYERFRDDPDTKRVTVLRDIASFLFIGLNVGGSELLKMTTSIGRNIVLTTGLATAAVAMEDLTKYTLSEPEKVLAMRIIREVSESPQCHKLLADARRAKTIGFLFQDSNLNRAVRALGVCYKSVTL